MAFTHEEGWLGPYFAQHPRYADLNPANVARVKKQEEILHKLAREAGSRHHDYDSADTRPTKAELTWLSLREAAMITVVERFAVGWSWSAAISPVWRLSPYIEGESFCRFPFQSQGLQQTEPKNRWMALHKQVTIALA